jgi:hypothetical protein
MLAKRLIFAVLFLVLAFSTAALAQRADASFVAAAPFVSDSNANVLVICPGPTCPLAPNKIVTSHEVFLEGTVAVRTLNLRLASLHFEVPFAGLPSQKLTLSSSPSTVIGHLSSFFITPSFRLKVASGAPIAPWVSFGGGWAHYSAEAGPTTNKGALQYGGGLDFRVVSHLGLRFEVRDFVTGSPNFPTAILFNTPTQGGLNRHNVLAGGGAVFSF